MPKLCLGTWVTWDSHATTPLPELGWGSQHQKTASDYTEFKLLAFEVIRGKLNKTSDASKHVSNFST